MKRYFWNTLTKVTSLACPDVKALIDVGHGDLPPHVQEDFATLAFIESGEGVKLVGDRRYPLCDRSVFVIHPKVPHAYLGTKNLVLTNMCFTDALFGHLPSSLRLLPGFRALFHLEPIIRRRRHFASRLVLDEKVFDRMIATIGGLIAMKGRHPANELMATCRVTDLFAELALAYEQQHGQPESAKLPIKLAQSVLWIEDNLGRWITPDDVAEFSGISARSLSHAYKQVYGVTLKEFIMRLRLQKACDLLRSSSYNITEISSLCGISDPNYFSRQFRMRFGCQPRAYRSQNNMDGAEAGQRMANTGEEKTPEPEFVKSKRRK